jgi:hypothetical protein
VSLLELLRHRGGLKRELDYFYIYSKTHAVGFGCRLVVTFDAKVLRDEKSVSNGRRGPRCLPKYL